MAKYKQQIDEMLEINRDVFKPFGELHDKYEKDPKKWQEQFNIQGQEVLRLIRKWENMLCSKSESGKYGRFSTALSEKFWTEIRAIFPKIDNIGLL